jgi:hypothetical protein
LVILDWNLVSMTSHAKQWIPNAEPKIEETCQSQPSKRPGTGCYTQYSQPNISYFKCFHNGFCL